MKARKNIFDLGGSMYPYDIPVGSDMPVTQYDLLLSKQNIDAMKAKDKNKMTNPFMGIPKTLFDLGGDIQMNGADFSTGAIHINAGKSHEENPNDGVQMGVDNEGTPNLVEEGEVVYNDYVFSNRIMLDEEAKKKLHFPKKKDITYADAAKRLEKEIAERPADPISEAGFKAQMQTLEEAQENQKAQMEAARAREAFEALSPEEQTSIMQQAAQQEQMAQQAAQEQAMAEQQASMQQPSPEDMAMMQQQISPDEQAMMQQQQLSQMQANVSALGGELVKASDVEGNKNIYAFAGRMGKRQNRRLTQRYTKEWFDQQAKALGIDDELMSRFKYTNDAEGNLAAFNKLYRESQYNKALETYRAGQRQDRRNKLFGDNGLYRYSNDKSKIYRGRVNETDRTGYINRDYTGEDENGVLKGFLSTDDYNLKKAAYEAEKDANKKAALLKELEGYKAINEKAGDYMHDFLGHRIESLENRTEDEILDNPNINYSEGFKWNDKDAQTLQYPAGMDHSNLSYLRYVPALGGAVGLVNDLFSKPDYSRAQDVINAGRGFMTPREVTPHYIGNYLTYKPLDIWYQQNALNAQSRATDRALLNNTSPSRMAGLLSNGYNSQLASGNLFRQAQEYNDALKQKVEEFNRGTNIFNAQADMNTQQANQNAWLQAGRTGLPAIMAGNQMMDDIDARRAASLSANATNLLQSIGNIGEEAYDEDRLKWLEGTGVLRSDYFNKGKYSAAKGGKLKKRRRV